MTGNRRKWTPQEDELLRRAVETAQAQSRPLLWRELAKSVPGRSNKNCRRRWWNSLVGGTAKGSWSEEEDERLITAVRKHGTNWRQVSRDVASRNPDQCSSHWSQVLDPNINYCDWTSEEDSNLLHAVLTYGTNWATIALSHVPARTTLALKNRYSTLRLRHDNRAKGKDERGMRTRQGQRPRRGEVTPAADEDGGDDDDGEEEEDEEEEDQESRDQDEDEDEDEDDNEDPDGDEAGETTIRQGEEPQDVAMEMENTIHVNVKSPWGDGKDHSGMNIDKPMAEPTLTNTTWDTWINRGSVSWITPTSPAVTKSIPAMAMESHSYEMNNSYFHYPTHGDGYFGGHNPGRVDHADFSIQTPDESVGSFPISNYPALYRPASTITPTGTEQAQMHISPAVTEAPTSGPPTGTPSVSMPMTHAGEASPITRVFADLPSSIPSSESSARAATSLSPSPSSVCSPATPSGRQTSYHITITMDCTRAELDVVLASLADIGPSVTFKVDSKAQRVL